MSQNCPADTDNFPQASRVGQQHLFPDWLLPEGFVFEPDFLTMNEESDLLTVVCALPFAQFRIHGVVAKRRIVQASDFPEALVTE